MNAEARRIVSLVPSLTESLFSLGLGERVVAVTEWCIHPAKALEPLPRVGGTKNPDVEKIVALGPDLVIANKEENTRRDVERMRTAGLEVWVTDPNTVADGAALLRELSRLGASAQAVAEVVQPVEAAVEAAVAATKRAARRVPVFCPIWKAPWMAVGADTYAGDLLALCGGHNVFAERDERRYPIVKEAEIVAAAPEVVLLPDEPYAFGAEDAREIAAMDLPAARTGRIHLIDGTLVSWYGPRIQRDIEVIGPLLAR